LGIGIENGKVPEIIYSGHFPVFAENIEIVSAGFLSEVFI
jgi:hypothetical protein